MVGTRMSAAEYAAARTGCGSTGRYMNQQTQIPDHAFNPGVPSSNSPHIPWWWESGLALPRERVFPGIAALRRIGYRSPQNPTIIRHRFGLSGRLPMKFEP